MSDSPMTAKAEPVTEGMVVAAMREFEKWSAVLRYREKDKWHVCDVAGMREAIKAALTASEASRVPDGAGATMLEHSALYYNGVEPVKLVLSKTGEPATHVCAAAVRALASAPSAGPEGWESELSALKKTAIELRDLWLKHFPEPWRSIAQRLHFDTMMGIRAQYIRDGHESQYITDCHAITEYRPALAAAPPPPSGQREG